MLFTVPWTYFLLKRLFFFFLLFGVVVENIFLCSRPRSVPAYFSVFIPAQSYVRRGVMCGAAWTITTQVRASWSVFLAFLVLFFFLFKSGLHDLSSRYNFYRKEKPNFPFLHSYTFFPISKCESINLVSRPLCKSFAAVIELNTRLRKWTKSKITEIGLMAPLERSKPFRMDKVAKRKNEL